METSLRRYIFLIRRSSGETLLLHPFRPGDDLFRHPEDLVLEGRYATEPDAASTDSLRSVLHVELEKGARKDALERGFYTRLAASAAVFLGLYLFLSIVIRDPVPLVDELLVGGLGAFACWFAMERRSLSSAEFATRQAELRKGLDSALFQTSRVSKALEESLQDAETLDPELYSEYLNTSAEFVASAEDTRELEALATALRAHLGADAAEEVHRFEKEKTDATLLIRRVRGRKRMDIPVLLSYARLRALLKVDR